MYTSTAYSNSICTYVDKVKQIQYQFQTNATPFYLISHDVINFLPFPCLAGFVGFDVTGIDVGLTLGVYVGESVEGALLGCNVGLEDGDAVIGLCVGCWWR